MGKSRVLLGRGCQSANGDGSLSSIWMAESCVLDKQSVIVDMSVKPTPCTQGHIAQWLEHPVYNWEVLSSNPSLVIF